jgi:cysteine desulfurase
MIYADYNGSAPLSPEVQDYLITRLQSGPYANPNAIHSLGAKTLLKMEKARSECAKYLGANPAQVIFNSGSTEGICTAFHSVLENSQKKIMVVSAIEHSSVINTAHYYETLGFTLKILPVDSDGVIQLAILKQLFNDFAKEIALVAIMAANNETGVIQPYQAVNQLCLDHDVRYLCDTTQFIGKTPFDFKESNVDFAFCSGHKLGAMTGAGILLAKNPESIKALIIGGGQEKNHRGGTQHYIGNETLPIALKTITQNFSRIDELAKKRHEFEQKIKHAFPMVVILGENAERLSTTTYISYPGLHGQAVQIELESQDIFVTTSSACSDNMPVTSKVLRAMNVSDAVGRGVVRISIGLNSPLSYYDELYIGLSKAYTKLSKVNSF